jgi:hypothetical protein
MHDDDLTTDADEYIDCPPPQRWAWDTVEGPMAPGQQAHYDRLVAAAGIPEGDLPDHVRLVLRWVAAGDATVCGGLADLLERVREAGFRGGLNHP